MSTFERADPPRLEIVIGLEQPLKMRAICRNDGEKERLREWIEAKENLWEIVERAIAIVKEKRAA